MLPAGFWLNWWVQLALAVATFFAVAVALFGDFLRNWMAPPRLRLEVPDTYGVSTPVAIESTDGSPPRPSRARYYRVHIHNDRRWFPAHQVQVLLLQVEEPGPNGVPQVKWRGEVPLIWENQSLYPAARTIGRDANVDLCAVVEGHGLALQTMLRPLGLQGNRPGACNLIVTVQAKSDEGDSPPLRVQVAWDGGWVEGAQEMRDHFVYEVVQ